MKAGSSDFNNLFSPSAKISALSGKLDFESPSSPFAFLVKNIPSGATVLDARCHYGQAGEYLAAALAWSLAFTLLLALFAVSRRPRAATG